MRRRSSRRCRWSITLGAALIFGEPVGWRRWLAIAAGFVGVLVIVRPGMAGFNEFALLALASVAFCTVRDLATRRIPSELPSLFITLVDHGDRHDAPAPSSFSRSAAGRRCRRALGLLALAAVLLLIGYQCVITALRTGDISAIAPFRYTALLWAMLLGYLAFGDKPDWPHGDRCRDHRAVRPLRLLPRARAQPPASGRQHAPACRRKGCDTEFRAASAHGGVRRISHEKIQPAVRTFGPPYGVFAKDN